MEVLLIVQRSSISLATTHTEWRMLRFLAKGRLRNETLAFADASERYQNNAVCGFKSAAPSSQKMKVKKNEYISNHVCKNVAIFQDVLSRDVM